MNFRPGQATKRDLKIALAAGSFCAAVSLIASVIAARADVITIGAWDNSNPAAGVVELAQYSSPTFTMQGQLGPNFFGVVSTAIFADALGSIYHEGAFNNLSAVGEGTMRLYIDFDGVTSLPGQTTFPTIFQASESALPGYVVADQVFLCSGPLFCDDYIIGGGTLLGQQIWSGITGTTFPTFSATVPGTFSIDEVFTIAYNGFGPTANVAGAILTQPDVAVPGPIVGAGLPGIVAACSGLLFLARRRRQKVI